MKKDFMADLINLNRFALLPDRTLGTFIFGDTRWYTIERPWKDNIINISCIPEGYYNLIKVKSPRFGGDPAYGGQLWEVSTVTGRTHILLHIANYATDVIGCIGLGKGLMGDMRGVSHSRTACTDFYAVTAPLDLLELKITRGPMQ